MKRYLLLATIIGAVLGIVGYRLWLQWGFPKSYPFCSSMTGNDSYACNFTPPFNSYDKDGWCMIGEICTGTVVQILVDSTQVGNATFSPNGLPAKNINTYVMTIKAGSVITLVYDRKADVWKLHVLETGPSGSRG